MQSRLRGSGHGIAAARMDAKLNVAGWIAEQMGGIRSAFLLFHLNIEDWFPVFAACFCFDISNPCFYLSN